MKKYFKIAWIVIRNSYIRDSKIPGAVIANLASQFFEFFVFIIFFNIIFSNTKEMGGWNFYQVLFLYSFARIITTIHTALAKSGTQSLSNELVRWGDFDFYLIKPADAMIMVSLSKPSIYKMLAVVFALGLAIYAIVVGNIHLGLFNVFWFLILGGFGLVLYYFLMILTVIPTFWFIRLWSLPEAMNRLSQFMRYPVGMFPGYVKIILLLIFPILAVSYIPARILFYPPEFRYIIFMIFITVLFGFITKGLWYLGTRSYGSASS